MAEQQKDDALSKEKVNELKEAFKRFDKDGDNTISCDDLPTVMRSLNMNPTDEEVKAIVTDMNIDASSKIKFDIFEKCMTERINTVDEEGSLREAFKIFDKDGSGYLEKEELKAILQDDEDIDELMKAMDTNGDGRIDFEEFVAIMTK